MSGLLLFFAVLTTNYSQIPWDELLKPPIVAKEERGGVVSLFKTEQMNEYSLNDIQLMLQGEALHLNPLVINKVLSVLQCATQLHVDYKPILTIIDYSLPSNEKRLWVFDLKEKKVLFYTFVAHGIKSGALMTDYFSNKFNSKASSIGVYQTQHAYFGRDGLSLRLDGLDRTFNDNASNRSIVIHSAWYVEEYFIQKYKRPGRSWGCPALPLENSQAIINTIKEKSLLILYYPNDLWFNKSKFLNCNRVVEPQSRTDSLRQIPLVVPNEPRDAVLFAVSYKGGKHAESKPVLVISADTYEHLFHSTAPLTRMLRRQINDAEYIALSPSELDYLVTSSKTSSSEQETAFNAIQLVVPVLKVVRNGYYETQMHLLNLGKIKEIKSNANFSELTAPANSFSVYFEKTPPVYLEASKEFIRWVGL